jgi:tRNA-dependent cyclodipeptide synthase
MKKPPIRVRFLCSQDEKKTFSTSHCIVAVSILGQPKTDKEKFAAILKRVNQHFSQCTILLADTLHRHTFKIMNDSKNMNQLYDQAIDAGDEWLARNQSAIDALTIPHTTMRWYEWLNHPNYKSMKALIDEFYEKNSQYRIAIFNSVQEYLLRLDKNSQSVNCPSAFKCSAEYLKEESAVMQLLAYQNFNYILYPGKRPESLQLTYDHFIKPFYPNRLRWVELIVRTQQVKKPAVKAAIISN